jgi:hypothetical protein
VVVVWRVLDTAQAVFEVDDFERYVNVQAEAAVRHLAAHYAYDDGDDGDADEVTLLRRWRRRRRQPEGPSCRPASTRPASRCSTPSSATSPMRRRSRR